MALPMHSDIELNDVDISRIALLDGVPLEKRPAVLRCMGARISNFKKGASLKEALVKPQSTYYLASGLVRIMRVDFQGERTILCDCGPDTLLFSADVPSIFRSDDVQIMALQTCVVIGFSISKDVEGCACCVKYVSRVRENIAKGLSSSNEQLLLRLDILSRRTIRAKTIAFLAAYARMAKSDSFEIKMTRQDLADYLCVERSALSRELSKMRDEGLVECDRSRFTLCGQLSMA